MNLQEAMNYRTQCILCGRSLTTIVAQHEDSLTVRYNEEGLRITGRHYKQGIKMLFRHNGTFERQKRDFAVCKRPIQIWRGCPVCRCSEDSSPTDRGATGMPGSLVPAKFGNVSIISKSRSVGATIRPITKPETWISTLENLKSSGCLFTFSLWGDKSGKYDLRPKADILRYFNEEGFWHMTTDFDKDSTVFQHGKFAQTLRDCLTLRLPAASMCKVVSKDDFLNKFKLYTLFS